MLIRVRESYSENKNWKVYIICSWVQVIAVLLNAYFVTIHTPKQRKGSMHS